MREKRTMAVRRGVGGGGKDEHVPRKKQRRDSSQLPDTWLSVDRVVYARAKHSNRIPHTASRNKTRNVQKVKHFYKVVAKSQTSNNNKIPSLPNSLQFTTNNNNTKLHVLHFFLKISL